MIPRKNSSWSWRVWQSTSSLPRQFSAKIDTSYGGGQDPGNQDYQIHLPCQINGGLPWRLPHVWGQSWFTRIWYPWSCGVRAPLRVSESAACVGLKSFRKGPLQIIVALWYPRNRWRYIQISGWNYTFKLTLGMIWTRARSFSLRKNPWGGSGPTIK